MARSYPAFQPLYSIPDVFANHIQVGHKIMSEFLQYALPAITGLIAGAVGSIIAPWVNWGVEKRRRRHEFRKGFLEKVRREIVAETYSYPHFQRTVEFAQLFPLLSRAARKKIQTKKKGPPADAIITIGGRDEGVNTQHRGLFLDELSRIERKWQMI